MEGLVVKGAVKGDEAFVYWKANSLGKWRASKFIPFEHRDRKTWVRVDFPIRKIAAWKVLFRKEMGSRNLGCARPSYQTQFAEETTALS